MTAFIFNTFLLILLALLFVVFPLFSRRGQHAETGQSDAVAVTRKRQLEELESDLDAGLIDNRDYEKARREIEAEANEDRRQRGVTATDHAGGKPVSALVAIVLVPVLTVAMYLWVGTPAALDQPTRGSPDPTVDQMDMDLDEAVARLEERLAGNPDDLEGWILLGRTRVSMGNYTGAVQAFSEAVDLAGDNNPRVVADYAEALVLEDSDRLTGQAAPLFEHVLTLDPDHPKGLWYGGMLAYEQGDWETATERWERLQHQDAPQEFANVLEEYLRSARQAAETGVAPGETAGRVRVALRVPEDRLEEVREADTVFVIARSTATPEAPPLAGLRVPANSLPTEVALDDDAARIEGQRLEGVGEVEIIATVSATGDATPEPGMPMGRTTVNLDEDEEIRIELELSDRVQ